MANIRETALAYEGISMKNIADLKSVSTDLDVVEKTFKQGTPDEFTVLVVTIDGEDYRVPASVLKDLKVILEKKPDLKEFSVGKSGSGMNTNYTVITV